MVTPDVFISYKREERERCAEIYERLKALKLEVWFDARLEPGTRFDDEIEQAIRAARAVLVLWSPAAARSEWIRNEATVGKSRNVLSSAFIQPVELPIAFLSTQTEDLSQPHFRDDSPGWLSTLRRLGGLVGRPGLDAYAQLLATPDAEGFKRWATQWPQDPLAPEAWRRAEELEVQATRARLQQQREGARADVSPHSVQRASASAKVVESGGAASLLQRLTPWHWAALVAGLGLLVWLLIPAAPVVRPVGVPPTTAGPLGEAAPSAQPLSPAAPELAASPVQVLVPKPPADADTLAAARRAIHAISQRDWGVLGAEELIGKATRVAPFEAIQTLAGQGDAGAQTLLAFATESGLNGRERNVEEALRLYQSAARQGHANAQANLGWKYSSGVGTLARNDAEAVRLFRLSAEQSNPLGQANLAAMTEAGRGGLQKDEAEAARLYKLAAAQGSALAQANLGHMYESGRGGLAKDERQALQLYRLAADQGNAYAQSALGVFYRDALGGLLQNDEEAVRLFKLAVAKGDPSAHAKLGHMYDSGRGGLPKDHAQAVRLYKRAAKLGDQWSQDELRRLDETF